MVASARAIWQVNLDDRTRCNFFFDIDPNQKSMTTRSIYDVAKLLMSIAKALTYFSLGLVPSHSHGRAPARYRTHPCTPSHTAAPCTRPCAVTVTLPCVYVPCVYVHAHSHFWGRSVRDPPRRDDVTLHWLGCAALRS